MKKNHYPTLQPLPDPPSGGVEGGGLKKDVHRCADCRHAELHDWPGDPLIARCMLRPPTAQRHVARSPRLCRVFDARRPHEPPRMVHHKTN